ncbi:Nodulation protein nolNO [Phycicoccus elongatus Lp2]|uniref:Nodulation protein nolNO n=1 Tax=Phycicoccus elongatus Lp2 TaxID=1193181 RepID=N0E131_9MICO|nr:carbamoyltransferase C-terminal domain-containing protein [Phycicoccus elongatus]CCH69481.1 Nodulation protein nolNO [Phycicoccus elongatus Lp2]
MLVLGISGSFNTEDEQWITGLPRGFFHDSAAAIVEDGRVLFAAEEERLSRVKHTHAFPLRAIQACLRHRAVSLRDIDEVAFFFDETFLDHELSTFRLGRPDLAEVGARARIGTLLDGEVDPERINFVPHHVAHAAATYRESGFDQALVLVMDSSGEAESVSAFRAGDGELALEHQVPTAASLGQLYFRGTRFLGFRLFDEYKVMGLAPYGDPTRYRKVLSGLYELGPDATYQFDAEGMDERLLRAGIRPRRQDEPLGADHRDFAAALQETLETIVGHVAGGLMARTGQRNLCLSGGVAQNCTMNGRLASSGRFSDIFVHPASHDGGAALGAAFGRAPGRQGGRRRRTDLGTDIGSDADIGRLLDAWGDHVTAELQDDIADAVAGQLAAGLVVGWAQGRAEFGPRALGHRSIVADPRPAANRDRINRIIKQRESFRPFAPAVLAERANDYFQLAGVEPDFMTFALTVRARHRELLGAVTHVDGSARVQVVRRDVDHLFWRLIDRFGARTGTPVLLNTSFNSNTEPIVDSAADAVRCFLTTGLDQVAIGSYLVSRKALVFDASTLVPVLTPTVAMRIRRPPRGPEEWELHEWSHPTDSARTARLSTAAAGAIIEAAGHRRLGDCVTSDSLPEVEAELISLWHSRLVDLVPAGLCATEGGN